MSEASCASFKDFRSDPKQDDRCPVWTNIAETDFHPFHSMIPFSFCNPPIVFIALILLNLLQLFFRSSSSLQINHTDHQNRSTISIPHYTDHNQMPLNPQKKLQRLPHVFSQVLELPLRSQADVFIEDRSDCFRFTANVENNVFAGGQVRAYAVKIHPAVTKVVVRGGNRGEAELLLDKLEVDVWRFRLPTTTRPELATAAVTGGKLIVTVPKGGGGL
ncbi:hypothetical protein L1987_22290 [Smallanthus sonchifolius]|uniref:Uncharacterized protein n=1 Tax=Smallanthus sonchifolius TaxID=185202 RepID=A0ACB9IF07_9ASTR|nr:hypothetical protein L1987_22290 [Smallanthus sonchifolius]